MQDIILLHGAIGAKDQLLPLAETLSNRFRVHRLSFTGHGGKPMADEFSIGLFCDDVLGLMARNKITQAFIFGYSMGGYVALKFAHMYPERVLRVFTFATKFQWSPEIAEKEIKMLDPATIEKKVPAFAAKLQERHHPNDWKTVLERTAAMMRELGKQPVLTEAVLSEIRIPVMITVGDKDMMVSAEETINTFRMLPAANLAILPYTSHPIEKMNLDRMEAEVKQFMLGDRE
jgi:pimeloyl-ACP methyl ester carboxylesterase